MLLSSGSVDNAGNKTLRSTYEYTEDGILLKQYYYSKNSTTPIESVEYYSDGSHHILCNYHSNGNISIREEYTKENTCLNYTTYYENGNKQHYHEYNDETIILLIEYAEDGSVLETQKPELDANGNYTKKITGSGYTLYSYDTNGNCVEYKLYYNDSDEVITHVVYAYDENNRLIKQSTLKGDQVTDYEEYQYDAKGNEIMYKLVMKNYPEFNVLVYNAYDTNNHLLKRTCEYEQSQTREVIEYLVFDPNASEENNPPETENNTSVSLGLTEKWYGTYASHIGYNPKYFVIEEHAVTYYQNEQAYTYEAKDYDITIAENQTTITLSKEQTPHLEMVIDESYGIYPVVDLTIYSLDNQVLDSPITVRAKETTILNYEPIGEAASWDDLGPWGKIPYSAELEEILMQYHSEDFIITASLDGTIPIWGGENNSEVIAEYEGIIYYCTSYNADGANRGTTTVCSFATEEGATAYYEAWCSWGNEAYYTDYAINDTIFYFRDMDITEEDTSTASPNQSLKYEFRRNVVATDTHCVTNGYGTYYYYAKPVSQAQCNLWVQTDKLLNKMFTTQRTSTDGQCQATIAGTAREGLSSIWTNIPEYTLLTINEEDTSSKGDTLLLRGFCTIHTGYIAIVEVTKEDSMLHFHLRGYMRKDNVTFENYLEKEAWTEQTFDIDLNSSPTPNDSNSIK